MNGDHQDAAQRRPGRPRDARADEAIVEAVVDLLTEVGFAGLTIDAVAQRAGVGKATIYRRWEGKEPLVLDALSTEHQKAEVPDTGSLRSDLLAYYLPLAEPDAQRGAIRLMPALAAQAAADEQIAARLRSFVNDRRAPVGTMIERARERGEVAGDVDAELAIDLLVGPISYRLYFSGLPVDRPLVEALVDRVVRAIGA
ncbi:MAG: TetR/AcrR family transcriptional regulator [Acidimicrobiales bacterium]